MVGRRDSIVGEVAVSAGLDASVCIASASHLQKLHRKVGVCRAVADVRFSAVADTVSMLGTGTPVVE